MKTAVINTGYLRTAEKCRANQWGNLLSRYNCDEYYYTHEPPEYIGADLSGSVSIKQIPYNFYPTLPTPHRYYENKAPETEPCNVLNMWHNLFISFCLVPNTYDCYVRNRPDIQFNGAVHLNNEPGKVYIPHGNDYRDGINDQFAYGCYESMRVYFSLYLFHERYFNQGVMFHPEGYLNHHLKENGIEIVRVDPTQWILRP
jgi:hypothetical protein